jgi:hypothetical protein
VSRREQQGPRALVVLALAGLASFGALACGEEEGTTSPTVPPRSERTKALDRFISEDFDRVDRDDDRSLDRREAEAAIRADFAAADLDGDGVLTVDDVEQELDRVGRGKIDKPLAFYLARDTDGDGEITEAEYLRETIERTHEPMDRDGDREISLKEGLAFHRAHTGSGG